MWIIKALGERTYKREKLFIGPILIKIQKKLKRMKKRLPSQLKEKMGSDEEEPINPI